jgi:carbonic anhydrase
VSRQLACFTARQRLDEGSQAFAALIASLAEGSEQASRVIQVDARDLGLMTENAAGPKQRPFAAVLGCSDARVPIELIFNEGPNDLFVVRVAGNGLGNEVLGSLKYAIEHLGGSLKVVVVLGHSGCGALSAAVDVFLEPARYLALATSHPLRNILDRLLVVVQASAKKLLEAFGPDVIRKAGYRNALIESSIITNAALGAYTPGSYSWMDPEDHGKRMHIDYCFVSCGLRDRLKSAVVDTNSLGSDHFPLRVEIRD